MAVEGSEGAAIGVRCSDVGDCAVVLMGTCYSCNSRHSTPQQQKNRVAPLSLSSVPQSPSELESPGCASDTIPTDCCVAVAASSSGYVTGKSPLDTSASRYSDSTWNSENHPDFPSTQSRATFDRGTGAGKMSSTKKSLFDTPQLPQTLKCDLNLNNRPRLTSDYAQATQVKVLHSQPQSYATRRGILSYRRLEPMFPKVELRNSTVMAAESNNTTQQHSNANRAEPGVTGAATINAAVPARTFFHPSDIKNDQEAITSVLEFLKSPTAALLSNQNSQPVDNNANSERSKLGTPRAIRPTTLDNLKSCTPKMPPKVARPAPVVPPATAAMPGYQSPLCCRRSETQYRAGELAAKRRDSSPSRRRDSSPTKRQPSSPLRNVAAANAAADNNNGNTQNARCVSPVRQSISANRAWSPVKTERFFSRDLYLQRQKSPVRALERQGTAPTVTSAQASPMKSPIKTPLSHQSSASLNSDILERVEGLIDDDFVDQPSLMASSKNSLDSETSRCSVNLNLGMNRSMLMYHELARIKEQLLILRTTLEHCVDESGDDDLRRQIVLLNEELKDRDATIRKLQQDISNKKTPVMPERHPVKNVAVQTTS